MFSFQSINNVSKWVMTDDESHAFEDRMAYVQNRHAADVIYNPIELPDKSTHFDCRYPAIAT